MPADVYGTRRSVKRTSWYKESTHGDDPAHIGKLTAGTAMVAKKRRLT